MICATTLKVLALLSVWTLFIGFTCYMIGKEVQKNETDRVNGR